jgi:hypothetical protein
MLLQPYIASRQFRLDKKDIYRDKALLIKYRYAIPVLCEVTVDGELRELYWPFDTESLQRWLLQSEAN